MRALSGGRGQEARPGGPERVGTQRGAVSGGADFLLAADPGGTGSGKGDPGDPSSVLNAALPRSTAFAQTEPTAC